MLVCDIPICWHKVSWLACQATVDSGKHLLFIWINVSSWRYYFTKCKYQNDVDSDIETVGSVWNCGFIMYTWDFPDGSMVKNTPADAGEMGLIPRLGRSLGE